MAVEYVQHRYLTDLYKIRHQGSTKKITGRNEVSFECFPRDVYSTFYNNSNGKLYRKFVALRNKTNISVKFIAINFHARKHAGASLRLEDMMIYYSI